MVLSTELVYATDIPKITAENIDRYLESDPLFTEYFNTFMSMEIFLNPIHFKQELDCFEILSNKTNMEKKTENGNESEGEECCEKRKSSPDPNSIYINVCKNSYSTIPLINVRKEKNTKIKTKTPSPVYETLSKDVGLQWIKATRLSTFLRSLSYAEYRIAKLLSQAQIVELKHPKHGLMLDFRELEYQTAKQEDSYEVEKKTSLEYLMEALHISKGKTKLGDLEDWYRIQKSMISDEVSSDSMLVISREIFSESLTSKYSEKEVSKDEEDQEKGDQEDEVKESAADVSVKCVVFKDVSPIIYLEPIEDLVETPCDESEVSYLDSIQNLDQLAALVTVATFKSALAMLGSSSEERIMSDLASEPCLSKLNTFHFSITADKLNKKRTFDVLEDDEEAENKTGSKDANQEETTLPSNLEEDITPSENLEDVTPSTNLQQDVTPSNNVETPSNNLEQDVTPSNNLEQDVTPSNNLEQDVTPSNNLEQDVTPPNNLEQDVTPPNNVETPSSNLEDVTPSNNLEQDVTPLNNVETPSNNLEQDVTPSKNMEENPIPLNHVQENVLPQLDETDGTSSYSLGKAKTEPNIHMKHPVKRSSLPIDATSSEILGNIYSQSDLEEEPSWEDIIPEENESDAMNAEPLGTYTMETHEDFSNFYNFLKGTTGEKYWNLWVNVDRIKLMKTDIQKQMLIVKINENFAKVSESSSYQKKIRMMFKRLDLNHCSVEEIKDLQALLLQPLMLYWLPHYLLINLLKIELSKYPSYASLLNNKRKLWSTITCEEISEDMEVSQTPRIYMVETEEKEAPESKLYPPHILRLPPQMKRIGTRRTHLLSSLQNCGNYGNNAFNNLEKTKKEENDGSNEDKVKEGQTPMPKTKNKLNPPVPKVFVPRTTRDLPMLPEMTPATVETVGESNIGWTQRQHPMPKVVKVNRIIGALDHVVDPWTGQLEDHMGSTKIKLVNTLLVALRKESKCGNYFENFLTKCKNKLALNCLYLWHNIEKFLQIFYTQPVNMFRICRYAKFIYSKFIANGSPFTVRAGPKVMLLIWQNLDAPVGDMFDEAVEHILIILSKFWHRLLLEESWIYRKINH